MHGWIEDLRELSIKDRLRVVGMMSGTSFDGVDVAILDIRGSFTDVEFDVLGLHFHPYPEELRYSISSFLEAPSVEGLSELDIPVALEHVKAYEDALDSSGVPEKSIDLISMHGQTLWHSPRKMSIQVGNPDLVAVETGKFVVSDFRRKDIALGGEGAPITPYVDHCVFGRSGKVIALNNIGGMSNVTLVTGDVSNVLAFDTGPGNALIDIVAKRYFGLDYDPDGEIALSGNVMEDEAVKVLESDDYIRKPPPKSTGKERYNADFLKRFNISDPHDLMATVTYYTALTIKVSYDMFLKPKPSVVYFSGGGVKNRALMGFIEELLDIRVLKFSERFSDFKEAMWFAVLGSEFLRSEFSNIPSVTGARDWGLLGRLSVPR